MQRLKGNLKLSENAKREDAGRSVLEFELGEELEAFHIDGLESGTEKYGEKRVQEDSDLAIRPILCKEMTNPGSGSARIAADEKRSRLAFELSQKVINLETLQRIASSGLPDGGGLHATAWKLLLGYLPNSQDLWDVALAENRMKYAALKEELLWNPTDRFYKKKG